MGTIDLLARVEIFNGLNLDQLKKIEVLCSEKQIYANQMIFEENSPGDEFFVIAEGKVLIQLDPGIIRSRQKKKTKPATIATLEIGQSFGEITLVDEGVRSAAARAGDTGCRLLTIHRDAFMKLLKNDIEIGFVVMHNLAADLCFKIRNTNLMVREALLV